MTRVQVVARANVARVVGTGGRVARMVLAPYGLAGPAWVAVLTYLGLCFWRRRPGASKRDQRERSVPIGACRYELCKVCEVDFFA